MKKHNGHFDQTGSKARHVPGAFQATLAKKIAGTLAHANGQSAAAYGDDQSAMDADENPYLAVNSTGEGAIANGEDAIGLGSHAIAAGRRSVSIGVGSITEDEDTVSVGNAKIARRIVHVAKGGLVANSTDAVNGSQLHATNQVVNQLADALDDSGLFDPATGESLAVTYDDASKGSVTLGESVPVVLHNMAAGTDDSDGVNVTQLTSGLSELRDELINGAINLKYVKINSSGSEAFAPNKDAIAIGSAAGALQNDAVAIGVGAGVLAANSVAIGYNSKAIARNVFSVGNRNAERKIVNVADGDVGDESTDAVNGGQLYAVRKALDALATLNSTKDVDDPLAAIEGSRGHNSASLNGGDPEMYTAVAIGVSSVASGREAIALGLRAVALSDNSVALGSQVTNGADLPYAVSVGADARTTGEQAVALGAHVVANADKALAVGNNHALAIGESSVAMGDGANVRSDNSIAIGRAARVPANANDALALGPETRVMAGATGGVALGHASVADRGNALSIGGGTVGTRQIIHVSEGTEPTDAVNLAQLLQLKDELAAMKAEIQQLRSQLASRPSAQ